MRRIRQTAIVLLAAMLMLSAAAVSEGVVRLPAIQHVEQETFMNDTSIREVVIPEGVELIDYSAFSGCTALETVTISSSVEIIDEYAFEDCSSLVNLNLSEGLKEIYYSAFANCTSLREVTLPSSLDYIENNAFEGCDALETVNAREGTYAYAWAVRNGYIKPEGDFNVYPVVNDGEVSVGGDGVTLWQHLGGNGWTFSFAVSSKTDWSVSVSYGDEDSDWFDNDYADMTFGASERSIYFRPYTNETGRVRSATITFTSGSASKVFRIFQDPMLVAELVSPLELAEHGIPDYGYWDDDLNQWVDSDWTPPIFPMQDLQLVWDVPADAVQCQLYYCSPSYREDYVTLTPNASGQIIYTLPARRLEPGTTDQHIVQMRVRDAYGHNYYGEEYRFLVEDPENPEWGYALNYSDAAGAVQSVTLLRYNGSAKSVTIPSTLMGYPVVSTYGAVFEANETIESVVIPESLTDIEEGMFYGCANLKHVQLPSGLKTLPPYMFSDCGALEEIELPAGLTAIMNGAFSYCSSLRRIEIPSGVREIGMYAFEGCESLESISLPRQLRTIESGAFYSCSSLEQVELPAALTSIGWNAFEDCTMLERLAIPSGVKVLPYNMINGCSNLKMLEIPGSVTTIEYLMDPEILSGVTIYGAAGSEAERYANANGATFVTGSMPRL